MDFVWSKKSAGSYAKGNSTTGPRGSVASSRYAAGNFGASRRPQGTNNSTAAIATRPTTTPGRPRLIARAPNPAITARPNVTTMPNRAGARISDVNGNAMNTR